MELVNQWADERVFGTCNCPAKVCAKERALRERTINTLLAAEALAEEARTILLRSAPRELDGIVKLAKAITAFSEATGDLGWAYSDRMSEPMVVAEGDEEALRKLLADAGFRKSEIDAYTDEETEQLVEILGRGANVS